MSDREGSLTDLIAEAQRVLAICNACRYCEGYCPVFPALERRLTFEERDVHYLASLCHNCGACLYACQYAPPHEFAVNFPRVLSAVRTQTYAKYAWPRRLGAAFHRNGTITAVAVFVGFAICLFLVSAFADVDRVFAAHADRDGAFYALIPHAAMAWTFGIAFAFAVIACTVASRRFVSGVTQTDDGRLSTALRDAARDSASLKHLDGGGDGCTYPLERPSFARRRLHHLMFYGFMLCFASTLVASFDHYVLGLRAPYAFTSAPVVLGTLGGIALSIGTGGLIWLRSKRDRDLDTASESHLDVALVLLLLCTGVSGLALLVLRETRWMGVLLILHLSAVMAMFITLPYGKFVHALYRMIALVRFHRERRLPPPNVTAE